MDRRNAHELTLRLSAALDGTGSSVDTVQANTYAGADAGYVSRVHRPDGTTVDVVGSERSGYGSVDAGIRSWQAFDELAAALREPTAEPTGETSPTGDADLVDRLTSVGVELRRLDVELCAVRDELALRGNRVAG